MSSQENNITLPDTDDAIVSFCKLMDKDENLQSQVKNAANPKRIVDIASSTGHEFSSMSLRTASKHLTAAYFPWSQMGREWRINFFNIRTIDQD